MEPGLSFDRYGETQSYGEFTISIVVQQHGGKPRLRGRKWSPRLPVSRSAFLPSRHVISGAAPLRLRDLFTDSVTVPPKSLNRWFDRKTATFVGRDVMETVRDLVGHTARFGFQEVSPRIPLPNALPAASLDWAKPARPGMAGSSARP